MRDSGPVTHANSMSIGSKAAIGLASLLCLVVFASYHRQAAVMTIEAQPRHQYREGYLLPNPSSLEIIGLGHDEMMADLVWLRALGYFAAHFFLDQDYRWLDRYTETVIELDPYYRIIYQWAGVVTMYGGQNIDNRAVMNSIRFLEMGRERYPDDWLINFMLGVNYRYELVPRTPEERRQWRLLGATYLSRAAESAGAPAWLTLNASRNLETYGAAGEAIELQRQLFLNGRAVLAATLRAEMSLHQHDSEYIENDALQIDMLAASSIGLRERLPCVDWARLLQYRRLTLGDLDSDSGYLFEDLRILARGESFMRLTEVSRTPIDHLFSPTISALMRDDDQK